MSSDVTHVSTQLKLIIKQMLNPSQSTSLSTCVFLMDLVFKTDPSKAYPKVAFQSRSSRVSFHQILNVLIVLLHFDPTSHPLSLLHGISTNMQYNIQCQTQPPYVLSISTKLKSHRKFNSNNKSQLISLGLHSNI